MEIDKIEFEFILRFRLSFDLNRVLDRVLIQIGFQIKFEIDYNFDLVYCQSFSLLFIVRIFCIYVMSDLKMLMNNWKFEKITFSWIRMLESLLVDY